MNVDTELLRLDRWLWFARFYKTRSAATAAVKGGHVRINDERARPGYRVQIGDQVELMRQQLTYRIVVTATPSRRGPAREAQACYSEDPDTIMAREQRIVEIGRDRRQMPRTAGRPDKHTRRKLRQRNRGPESAD